MAIGAFAGGIFIDMNLNYFWFFIMCLSVSLCGLGISISILIKDRHSGMRLEHKLERKSTSVILNRTKIGFSKLIIDSIIAKS
jgi:hypothetical protein